MKLAFVLGMWFLLCLPCTAQSQTLSEVRLGYRAAAESEAACRQLIGKLSSLDTAAYPVHAGYRAAAIMMMAKHDGGPAKKFSYFEKGKKLMEKMIQQNPGSIELRYLRYAVQLNLPGFLGYKRQMKGDRVFLNKYLPDLKDAELKKMIEDILSQ